MLGDHTKQEISSQSAVWQTTLASLESRRAELTSSLEEAVGKRVLLTGCGSTYYLSLSAAALFRGLGLDAQAMPASELVLFPDLVPAVDSWLLAISRSGATTETVRAVDMFRKLDPAGRVVAVTTVPDSPLAQRADILIDLPGAQEKSVVQTRSFTSMYLAAQTLASILTGDQKVFNPLKTLPDTLTEYVGRTRSLARTVGADLSLQRFIFLGGGVLYGLANEAMLKMKEMTCSWTEAYHPLEFRHGPMSIADANTLIVGFVSDEGTIAEVQVLQEMKELGARTMALADDVNTSNWSGVDYLVELRSGLKTSGRAILYLPLVQRLGYYRALAKGLDPDQPINLSSVVRLAGE